MASIAVKPLRAVGVVEFGAEAGGDVVAARGRDLGGAAGLGDPAGDVALARVELPHHRVGVGDEVLDRLALVAQDLQGLLGLPKPGVSAAEDLGEVVRAAREAGAELSQDQPEPLAVGTAHDVADEVRRDRRLRVPDRDRGAGPELLRRVARLAVDVVLADQRLLADRARGVRAERLEPGLGDLGADDRARARRAVSDGVLALGPLRDLEPGGLPGADASHAQVAALREPESVVEGDPEGLARGGAARAG